MTPRHTLKNILVTYIINISY